MESEAPKRNKRMMFGCMGICIGILLAVLFFLLPVWKVAKKSGLLDEKVMREYKGNSMQNLKEQHTALMLYQNSEGMLPNADGWMDAIWPYMKAGDMSQEEAEKKLRNPAVTAENPLGFGYAFNEKLSGGYSDDIENPESTPLTFDSSDINRNAKGNPLQLAPSPERPGGNQAITLEGNVQSLEDILKGKKSSK